ncbi:hypothetical protein [Polymorphum gilvum]|uniref:Uncharacterized protein n=1 Tax=Polymorphum gilvum (strain LMG 25793 / CGMCC 1.9160 / SL003B-26A1) TaxID=991905 RepID=F2J5N9_POLGS|nr:hypothetical protein [Polymorphum gilvum]ADZ70123.1 hypothetical protein SL003B_1695 [Polymorphum gilvum SL003B-26A1]
MARSATAETKARANELDAAARHHKREERRHRQAARDARQKLAALAADCARLGISLTVHPGEEGETSWPPRSSTSKR